MSDVTVYMTSWCPFCHALFGSLSELGVSWEEVDVDHDDVAAAKVEQINGGNRVVPTVEFADGTTLTNPEGHEVVARLNALRS